MTLPNLIIAGLGRSGTTSMFQYLVEHPDVCGSKRKEASYFIPAIFGKPLEPIESYVALFDHYHLERIVVEATPGYFIGGRPLAELIEQTLGQQVRIVLSLRDPVTRLVSCYNHFISRLMIDPTTTLEEYIDLCERSPSVLESRDENSQRFQGYYGGFYGEVLPGWFDVFGDRLRVVFFERLEADAEHFMVDLARWVGIDPSFYCDRRFDVQNQSRTYRFGAVHKLANAVNDRAEFPLRRRPGLKNALRTLYLRLNDVPPSSAATPAIRRRLRAVYSGSNRQTRSVLEQHGYAQLPDWLTGAPM